MLGDNLKYLRKKRGWSQAELAARLNVVRQTLSKWENGQSVPDSDMLIRISEIFETSVSCILDGEAVNGNDIEEQIQVASLCADIVSLNERLTELVEKRRRLWRMVFVIVAISVAMISLCGIVKLLYDFYSIGAISSDGSIIGGGDSVTNIYVLDETFIVWGKIILTIIAGIIAVVGISFTRRK